MAINFPNSPNLNELYSYDNKTWEWNGIYWEVYSGLTSYITSAYTVGNGYSVISGISNGNISFKSFSGNNISIIDDGTKLSFVGSPPQNVSGFYLPLSGGTVSGRTIFTSELTANTISANTITTGPVIIKTNSNNSLLMTTNNYVEGITGNMMYLNTSTAVTYSNITTRTNGGSSNADLVLQESIGSNVGIGKVPSSIYKLDVNGAIGATSISATTITTPFSGGSVLFAGTSGQISQNNSQLFWDNINNRLGIGTNAPTGKLYIKQSADNSTDGIMMMGFNNTSTVRAYVNFGGLFTINRGGADVMGINTTGNVLIGTTTDSGYKLDVNGTINSTSSRIGGVVLALSSQGGGTISSANSAGNNTGPWISLNGPAYLNPTAGNSGIFSIGGQYLASSGNAIFNHLNLAPTINNTATYSGTVRGIYYNPTLTSLIGTTHTAIETVTGNVILGSTSGNTLIGTSVDSGFKLNVSGNTRIVNQLQVGVFNVGVAGASSSIVTQGRISAAGGVTLYNPSSGDNQDTGIFNSGGLLIKQGNSSVATFATVGGASNGTNVAINQGYNPNGSGTGSVIGFSHDYALYPITSNTISYTSYYARPSWQSPTFYDRITGPIRGFLFSNNLYNTQKLIDVIAFQSDGGRVLHQGELPAPISGTSRGLHINQTHTAIANNNVLVGLDVQPTFNNGAFTGLTNIDLRTKTAGVVIGSGYGYGDLYGYDNDGLVQIKTASTYKTQMWFRPSGNAGGYNSNYWSRIEHDGGNLNIIGSSYGQLSIASYNGSGNGAKISFNGSTGIANNAISIEGPANSGRIALTTYLSSPIVINGGNLLVNTTTDAGFRLDVNGNTRITGNLTVSGNTNITGGLTATTISATTYQGVNRSFGVSFDGMGSVITVNSQSTLTIPYNMVIQSWVLLSDVTGSTVIDIWKDTYANYPPTSGDSITSLAKPSIVSGTKNQSSTLTGWNTIVNSGDIIRFNVDSCTGMTKATLTIIGKEF